MIRPTAPGLGPPKSGAGWALEPLGGLQVSAGATGRSGPGRWEGTGPGEGVQCREERVRSREGRAAAPADKAAARWLKPMLWGVQDVNTPA